MNFQEYTQSIYSKIQSDITPCPRCKSQVTFIKGTKNICCSCEWVGQPERPGMLQKILLSQLVMQAGAQDAVLLLEPDNSSLASTERGGLEMKCRALTLRYRLAHYIQTAINHYKEYRHFGSVIILGIPASVQAGVVALDSNRDVNECLEEFNKTADASNVNIFDATVIRQAQKDGRTVFIGETQFLGFPKIAMAVYPEADEESVEASVLKNKNKIYSKGTGVVDIVWNSIPIHEIPVTEGKSHLKKICYLLGGGVDMCIFATEDLDSVGVCVSYVARNKKERKIKRVDIGKFHSDEEAFLTCENKRQEFLLKLSDKKISVSCDLNKSFDYENPWDSLAFIAKSGSFK